MATNMQRYDPYGGIARMNPLRAFDELFRDLAPRGALRELEQVERQLEIPIDVRETDQAYIVRAEIPGAAKEDIKVDVSGNRVSITAEVRQEQEQGQGRVLRRELVYGQMQRTFMLDEPIEDTKATAKFENGVLELTLPKKQASGGNKVQIQ
jgi:HSP20 family protein